MPSGHYVFSQVMAHLPMKPFRRCVQHYHGNRYIKSFTCLDQFLCMAFAQLTYRESLRDIEVCLRAHRDKLYHMGLRGGMARNTLAHANRQRDWRLYADFAHALNPPGPTPVCRRGPGAGTRQYRLCPRLLHHRPVSVRVPLGPLPAKPSQRSNCIPCWTCAAISPPLSISPTVNCTMSTSSTSSSPSPAACYVMDRAYLDFQRLFALTMAAAFFVIRAKSNTRYRRRYSRPVDKSTGLLCNQTIVLTGVHTATHYPQPLRRIKYRDPQTHKTFAFLTNHFALPAHTITELYRYRWQVELFFKWIKQHLRIKAFFGTSENAVKTQIWVAVSVYVLVALIKKRLHLSTELYTMLQILSLTLFEKVPLYQLLTQSDYKTDHRDILNQLNLFD